MTRLTRHRFLRPRGLDPRPYRHIWAGQLSVARDGLRALHTGAVVLDSGAARRMPSVSSARVDTRPVRSDRLATLPTPHCQSTAADEGRDSDDEPDPTPGHEALGRELRVESLQDPDRSDESDHQAKDNTDDAHLRIVGVPSSARCHKSYDGTRDGRPG
jgi:hypothetical protein